MTPKPDMRGPDIAYTNEAARDLEQHVRGMMRLYNNDLHALLTDRRDLVEYIERLTSAASELVTVIDEWESDGVPHVEVGSVAWETLIHDLRALLNG
jgi:hypothetical protein